jgi:tRNA (guanine-N7-)-methyltransferase
VDGHLIDLAAAFGRRAPVVLEIGFGMGEAAVESALANPDLDFLAVDVHLPGQASLLSHLELHRLTNVRVLAGDARDVLSLMLPPASLSAVRILFPDPWPKRRHQKRRLLTADFAALVRDRLAPGGVLHVATDIAVYAHQTRQAVAATPGLAPHDPPPPRPSTRYERRARAAGRACYDLAAVRTGPSGPADSNVSTWSSGTSRE